MEWCTRRKLGWGGADGVDGEVEEALVIYCEKLPARHPATPRTNQAACRQVLPTERSG